MRPSGTLLAPTLAALFLATACGDISKLRDAENVFDLVDPAPADPRLLPVLAGWWRMEPKKTDALIPNILFVLRPDGALDFYRDDSGGTNFSSRFSGIWSASSPGPGWFVITFDFTGAEPRRRCFALPGNCSEYKLPFRETWSFTGGQPGKMETPGAVWWQSESPPDAAAAPGGGSPASGGDRADVTRPADPAPIDPGSTGSPSPDAIVDPMRAPVASGKPAPLGAPVPPVVVAEPTTVAPARTEAAPPAGRFAIYFFSVRPLARVASEWRRLMERHPELAGFEPRPPRPVDVPGKGTMYPVEAGAFATRAEAQAICDRLRSRDQPCRVLAP
jgi:hypothetical protein